MDIKPIVVFITAPSWEVARRIARSLVEKKLAACVNLISPITSIYAWEGKINEEEETLLVVKSRAELFEGEILPAVREIHPYQVPEIIALPISMGLPDYLRWVGEETRR